MSYMWGVLAALVVIAAGLIWHYRSRIPTPDWRFTVDINAHLDTRRDDVPTAAERFFSWALFEKVALLALLSIIFAQVLPDVRASNLGIVLGVTALVVVNAAVTQWLVRRGRTWATTGREFVAMLLINTAIVTIDSVFGSSTAGNAPKVNALFFVLLLSLMIALFDRFLATRRGHRRRTGATRRDARRQGASRDHLTVVRRIGQTGASSPRRPASHASRIVAVSRSAAATWATMPATNSTPQIAYHHQSSWS